MTQPGAAKPRRQKLDASWKGHRHALVLDGYPHTGLNYARDMAQATAQREKNRNRL